SSPTNSGRSTVGLPARARRIHFLREYTTRSRSPRPRSRALGLRAEDVLLEALEPDHVLGRLDADPHLVSIVLTLDRGPVDAGSHETRRIVNFSAISANSGSEWGVSIARLRRQHRERRRLCEPDGASDISPEHRFRSAEDERSLQ